MKNVCSALMLRSIYVYTGRSGTLKCLTHFTEARDNMQPGTVCVCHVPGLVFFATVADFACSSSNSCV
jgi:hypothetical protein